MRGAGWLLVLLTAVFRYMMCEGGRVVTCSSDCCVQVHDVRGGQGGYLFF